VNKELTALTGLKAAEVSLVTRGANRKKRFPIFKTEESMDMQEILKAVLETETDGEAELDAVLKEAKVSDKGQGAAKGALRILQAFKDEMPKDVLAKLASIAGYTEKAKKPEDEMMNGKDKMKTKKKGESEEDDEYGYPDATSKKVKKGLESLPEDVRKDVEGLFKAQTDELEALRKQNDEVQKSLKAERDARELESWVEKAKTELSHFPGQSAEEMGKTLKGLADINPELAKKQFEQMKAASAAIKKSSMFSEGGIPTNPNMGGGGGSAWDQITKMADGIVEKSDKPMSREKAMAQVMKNHPDLYQRYLSEHPQQLSPAGVE
jgi:hypothetical protein